MKSLISHIIKLFASNNYSKDVEQNVIEWLVDDQNSQLKEEKLLELWNETPNSINIDTLASMQSVRSRIQQQRANKKGITSKIYYHCARYAAVIALIATSAIATYLIAPKEQYPILTTYTPVGEIKTYTLPDGTIVRTNSETMLLYPEQFDRDNRTVFLTGEAYFNVTPDSKRPFIVKSADLAVTALGTSFNISAYLDNDNIITTLITGKVNVDLPISNTGFILNKGEQIVYNKATKQSAFNKAVDLDNITAWQSGLITFKEASIEHILWSLEKKYHIEFEYSPSRLSKDLFNFTFHKDSSICDVLDIIKQIVGDFEYEITDNICSIN